MLCKEQYDTLHSAGQEAGWYTWDFPAYHFPVHHCTVNTEISEALELFFKPK